MEPDKNLLCPELRLAKCRKRRLHLGKGHRFEIFFHLFFLNLQMKKPSASCTCG